jgi:hypothetical protein
MQITTIGLGLLFASRPVGFLRPANPISVGFAEGLEPRTQIGVCTEFSRWVGDDVAVFAASGPPSRRSSYRIFAARCVVAARRGFRRARKGYGLNDQVRFVGRRQKA